MRNATVLGIAVWLLACTAMAQPAKRQANHPADGKTLQVYSTAKGTTEWLTPTQTLSFTNMPQPTETDVCVFVDPGKSFQRFFGMGAALTDAAAETFYKLPADKQQEFLKRHFSLDSGLGYTVVRTNINSCDFSSGSYTYVADNDKGLASFDIAPDKKFKLPFIKESMAAAGGKLNLFASPWSPPAWMKDNNNMLFGGALKKEHYATWAQYFARFIKAYEKEGVPVWGLSIQNEPMARQIWESCIYTAEQERDFLKNHLGPVLQQQGLGNKKIIVWDHNRDLIYQRAQTYFDDAAAAKYIWGIGFHWYEDWSGGKPMYDNIRRVQEAWPSTNIFFTEGCAESFKADRYDAWELGEAYGESLINDFNNGMTGFTDWNILLDETGGPNHVGNFCFAPVHGITTTGELRYTNAYYYIGHFSKFIRPGAKRIIASPSRSQLLSTAFVNTDGSMAVVVMNQTDKATPYYLWIKGKAVKLNAAAHSIATLVMK